MKKQNKKEELPVWVATSTEDTLKSWVTHYSRELVNVKFVNVQ